MKDESKLEVPGSWFEVDFHVHTPGSFDFQGIGKDDSGYIWLLEQAKNAKLDALVITDHNDIVGYQKLVDIENDLRRTQRTLERNNSPVPDAVLAQIALYEQIILLPGVELDVYPNIHLIVIFDPQQTDDMPAFLNKAGYTTDVRGDETSSKFGKWNFDEALQEAAKINAIVIAAHVDSNKGIYNASKEWGQNRISAFSNENLYGMEFVNPITRDKIENILKSPDYARNTRLAFIQSSDYHGNPSQTIGERRTYVRMDNINKKDKNTIFLSLKRALRNPDEFISAPERPELQAILRKLVDKPSVESLNNDAEKKRLLQYVCAYANAEDGTIAIGRNPKGNWVGEQENSELEFEEKVRSSITSGITPPPNIALQIYSYFGSNYIATIRVRKHSQICALTEDDRIYILRDNQPCRASSKEVVDLVEGSFIERYSHLSITNRISSISQILLGTGDSIDILPIVRKIDKNAVPLRKALAQPVFGTILNNEYLDDIEFTNDNGCTDGNIILLEKTRPRFPAHYLRVSAPIGIYKEMSAKHFDEMTKYDGEKIIIAPGGAVYYDNHKNIIVACEAFSPLIFTKSADSYSASLKFAAAYLKSSVAIWYAERCLGSYDIRKGHISNLPIPEKVETVIQQKAEKLIDTVLELECEFLKLEAKLALEYPSQEARQSDEYDIKSKNLVSQHNSKANKIIGEIDGLFYSLFGFSNKEIDAIEQVLKSSGIATFNSSALN